MLDVSNKNILKMFYLIKEAKKNSRQEKKKKKKRKKKKRLAKSLNEKKNYRTTPFWVVVAPLVCEDIYIYIYK